MAHKDMVSLKELARKANVSTATISRVLNNTGRFSEKTRDRILRLVRETGYVPNVAAKALRTRTARAIGLVVPDIVNEFFSQLVDTFGKALFEKNYSLFVCNTGEDEKKNSELIDNLLGKGIDGLIYNSRFPLDADRIAVPVVFVDRVSPHKPHVAMVSSDNETGGRLAGQALVDAGSVRPTLMCAREDSKTLSTINARIAGFAAAMRENNIPWSKKDIIYSSMTIPDARHCVKALYNKCRDYDGIFATMDIGAIGALFGLEDAGLCVPDDINLVGFDDISFCEYCKPALTTIRQNTAALATAAIESLFKIIDGKNLEENNVLVPVELVVRKSTRPGRGVHK